jgi:hypothetical protein
MRKPGRRAFTREVGQVGLYWTVEVEPELETSQHVPPQAATRFSLRLQTAAANFVRPASSPLVGALSPMPRQDSPHADVDQQTNEKKRKEKNESPLPDEKGQRQVTQVTHGI